jgi:hypothetical protein
MMPPRLDIPAMEAGQRAVIIDEGATESIVFQVTFRGARSNFAWVIPVPGKPGPDDVDQGSQYFLDSVGAMTSPTVVTEAPGQFHGLGLMAAKRAEGSMSGAMKAGGPGGEAPTVVELERLHAGPYQVSVLAATGKGVLGDWLRARGYPMPQAVDRDLDGYVGRGWYFLATRVDPAQAGGEASAPIWQGDLPPLAVRFPRPAKLVYPLAISRAGVPDRCVLDLLILAPKPVDCDEAPAKKLPAGTVGHGSLWDVLNRASRDGQASVLLASLQNLPLNPASSFMVNSLRPKGLDWSHLWATRLWLRPSKERMVDLHFTLNDFAPGTVPARLMLHRVAPVALGTIIAWVIALLVIGAAVWLFATNRKACCGINVLAIVATIGLAWAGFSSGGSFYKYDKAAADITSAIKRFHDITGAFPERVSDLMAGQPPAKVLDASGNEVPFTAPVGWRPLLDELPDDPVTRWGEAWIVDLAAPGYVSSGAFKLVVEWVTSAAIDPNQDPRRRFGPPLGPGAGLVPKSVAPAHAVVLAHDRTGEVVPVWLGQDALTAEYRRGYGYAGTFGPGPDEATLLALVSSADAPPGQEGRWSSPVLVHGDGKAEVIGTEPFDGRPVAITAIAGTSVIVAGTTVPDDSSGSRPRGGPQIPRPPSGPCTIYRVEQGHGPRKLVEVPAVRGLADAGDGKHALVAYEKGSTGGRPKACVLGVLDIASGHLSDLPGAGDLFDGPAGPGLVAREGYAWFATGGTAGHAPTLRRRSPDGKVETISTPSLTGRYSPEDVPLALSPGPHGEAVVLAPEGDGGNAVVRVGASSPRVVAHLHEATRRQPGPRPSRDEDMLGVAWAPEGIADTDALVTFARDSQPYVLALRRADPRLRLGTTVGENAPSGPGIVGGEVRVTLQGSSPQEGFWAVRRGILRPCDAKPGWLAAVRPSSQFELSLTDTCVLGITRVERKGRPVYLVGDHAYPALAPQAVPDIDLGLDGFALVYEPLRPAK